MYVDAGGWVDFWLVGCVGGEAGRWVGTLDGWLVH